MYAKGEKIKLSISLLVSNSIDTIEKCMESLVPILKNVPSELIVVDTGGTDGSIEIARKYADEVVKFEWCNDFAKARNAGLDKAKGEWFLFLDDDEWFENTDEIVRFFNTDEHLKYKCGTYIIRNYEDKQGKTWNEVRGYRMGKLGKGVRFISAIHEMLDNLQMPEKLFNCYVHHYGYVFDNEEESRKHADRNISLLKEVLSKDPYDTRLQLQLAQEYRAIGEMQLSEDVCLNTLALIEEKKLYTSYHVKMLGWILHNVILMELYKRNLRKAYEYAQEYMKLPWINDMTKHNLLNRLIEISFDLKKYEECFTYFPLYEKTYQWFSKQDQIRRFENILNMDEIITEENLSLNYTRAIRAAFNLKDKTKAGVFINKLVKMESFHRNSNEIIDFLKYLLEEEKTANRNRILNYLLKNSNNKRKIIDAIESSIWMTSEQKRLRIILGEVESEDVSLKPYQILYHYEMKKNDTVEMVENYLEKKENIFNIELFVMDIIKELGINLESYIDNIMLERWMQQVKVFIANASEKHILLMSNILSNCKDTSLKRNIFNINYWEKKLKDKEIEQQDYEMQYDLLKGYCGSVLDLYKNIYHEEVFYNEYAAFLPKSCRFAVKIEPIFTTELTEIEIAKVMKEATEIFPEMAGVCKAFILAMKEKMKVKAEPPSEFVALGNMIKEKVRMFIAQGNYDAAGQTLSQLEKMLPGDMEIKELKKAVFE